MYTRSVYEITPLSYTDTHNRSVPRRAQRRVRGSIVQQVVRILSHTTDPSEEGVYSNKYLGYGGLGFHLVERVADEHDGLIKKLLQVEEWGETFSEKFVDKALRKLLVDVSTEEDMNKAAPRYVDELFGSPPLPSQQTASAVVEVELIILSLSMLKPMSTNSHIDACC